MRKDSEGLSDSERLAFQIEIDDSVNAWTRGITEGQRVVRHAVELQYFDRGPLRATTAINVAPTCNLMMIFIGVSQSACGVAPD
jgi:hypothetical protein